MKNLLPPFMTYRKTVYVEFPSGKISMNLPEAFELLTLTKLKKILELFFMWRYDFHNAAYFSNLENYIADYVAASEKYMKDTKIAYPDDPQKIKNAEKICESVAKIKKTWDTLAEKYSI